MATATQAMSAPQSGPVRHVWVLGASLGGPQALRAFLGAVRADLPVAFIIAQHIDGQHLAILAEQLSHAGPLRVTEARDGQVLHDRQAVLAPVDTALGIDAEGCISFGPSQSSSPYHPSIDALLVAVAGAFGSRSGAIIFSGMGHDGAQGCRQIHAAGGRVWAQDSTTCVIGSMPDNARATGAVSFTGSPQQLAQRLGEHLLGASSSGA